MPSFSLPTLPGSLVLLAYLPAFVAVAVVLSMALLGRVVARPGFGPAAAAAGVLAGWAALLPAQAWRAVLTPRGMMDALLLPAVAAVLLGLLSPWLRGRAERWGPVLLILLTGWWVAGAGRAEFWRVWLVVGLAAWALGRGATGARVTAAALALWGGLVLAGAPAMWIAAALVAVAASGAVWAAGGVLPPVLLVAVAACADLAAGRLVRGRVTAVDVACVLAVAAAWLVPVLAPRLGRRTGPLLAVPVAAAAVVGAGWVVARALR